MKIKEVIGRTGLTDRAIRLYISNGLIAPQCEKSYTGRSSFDFSEQDVEQLQKIALLRKAEFSIEQIKLLQQGGEAARSMLTAFLEEKRLQLERSQKVVAALADYPPEAECSVDAVCEKISAGFREAAVPPEDLKPTVAERAETWIFRIISIPVVVLFCLVLWGMKLSYDEEFLFPKLYAAPAHYLGVAYLVAPIALMGTVFFLYRKPRLNQAEKRKRRRNALILVILTVLSVCNPLGTAGLMLLPPVYSETDDPTHYLQLGYYERAFAEDIYRLFPANIPDCAVAEDAAWYPPDKFPGSTKYYYYHASLVDPNFELYAQWILPEEKYRAEIQRMEEAFGKEGTYRERMGEWSVMHFTDDEVKDSGAYFSFYFLMFAYNDRTQEVRYIASYAMDTGGELAPYFLSLDW